MFTVVEAKHRGIDNLSLIHDSFGTHAGDTEELFFVVRETMAAMYEQFDVFRDFRNDAWDQLSDENRKALTALDEEALPTQGDLDPSIVTQSLYSFA